MSNEALQNEVHANLPASLAVKAADSLFSHDKRTYTKIPTEVVHHEGGGGLLFEDISCMVSVDEVWDWACIFQESHIFLF